MISHETGYDNRGTTVSPVESVLTYVMQCKLLERDSKLMSPVWRHFTCDVGARLEQGLPLFSFFTRWVVWCGGCGKLERALLLCLTCTSRSRSRSTCWCRNHFECPEIHPWAPSQPGTWRTCWERANPYASIAVMFFLLHPIIIDHLHFWWALNNNKQRKRRFWTWPRIHSNFVRTYE